MKISSVRLGHANNSSSSHSILLGSKMPENLDVRSFEYGWEWFHLVAPKDKARYMAAMVFMALPKNIAYQHKASIIKGILGVDMASEYFKAKNHLGETPLLHADHQSAFSFPRSLLNREQVHAEFLQELCDHVVHNPRISIRGGNDNEEIPEAWQKDCGTPALKNIKTDSDEILFARKEGDWWILYNHRTGAKIRFSFKDDAKPLTHASTPELVDLKITDYCDKGCPFCYQASGENGKHAAVDDISHIVYGLREAQTFEIALGGGEPTAHPAFCQILEAIYHNGITPNFSSNSTDWMKDKKISKAVKEFCGSFAISNLKKIRDVLDWNTKGVTHSGVYSDQALPQATLQIPLGCYDEKTIKDTLRVAEEFSWDIPITLLGFKRFGRGTSFKPFSNSWILDFLQEIDLERFGADSVFIQEFGEDLKKRGISPTLFVDGEGAFSCYIDAVKREIGASSYSGDMKSLVRPGDNYVDMKEGLSHFPFSKVNVS